MMMLAVICAGGIGLLLGLTLRVPAVGAASFVAVIAGVVLTVMANWPVFESVLYCASLLVTLQVSFLVGGAVACARSRSYSIGLEAAPSTSLGPEGLEQQKQIEPQ
jgi:hypothetical protein